MTKVFQILHDYCHWETQYHSLAEAVDKFASNIELVEAPDYVFEGWKYVDGNFTGTFYLEEDYLPICKERYDKLTQYKIRQQYTDAEEYKILRERLAEKDGSVERFNLYNEYVEQCKQEACKEIYGENMEK